VNLNSMAKYGRGYFLRAIVYVISAFLAFVFWSWILAFAQNGFMRVTGWRMIDQSDEWHPIFMVMLVFLSVFTAYLIDKKIRRRILG